MKLFARLRNLIRGTLARWVSEREHANPSAVYEAAIQDRVSQYAKLREAAAGVIYMRGKLERELHQKSAELVRLKKQLDIAVERDDDAVALALIGRSDALGAEVDRVRAELTDLTDEAEAAKKNLVSFQNEIARLRDERVRMLARLANARARLRLQETLSGLSPEADIRALDTVRDHINRLVNEVNLVRDGADPELERRLGLIRDAEAQAGARAQLDELKRTRKGALVPMVLTPTSAPEPAVAR
jgi:phage shock protein A